jgi:hypothetical protein
LLLLLLLPPPCAASWQARAARLLLLLLRPPCAASLQARAARQRLRACPPLPWRAQVGRPRRARRSFSWPALQQRRRPPAGAPVPCPCARLQRRAWGAPFGAGCSPSRKPTPPHCGTPGGWVWSSRHAPRLRPTLPLQAHLASFKSALGSRPVSIERIMHSATSVLAFAALFTLLLACCLAWARAHPHHHRHQHAPPLHETLRQYRAPREKT